MPSKIKIFNQKNYQKRLIRSLKRKKISTNKRKVKMEKMQRMEKENKNKKEKQNNKTKKKKKPQRMKNRKKVRRMIQGNKRKKKMSNNNLKNNKMSMTMMIYLEIIQFLELLNRLPNRLLKSLRLKKRSRRKQQQNQ